jgi:hypothetical protein
MRYVDSFYIEYNTGIHVSRRNIQIICVDTYCGLESNFDKEKEVILKQQREITSKIADLKHSQHQIKSILDIKVESNTQFFLFQNKAKEQMKQNEIDIDNMLASLLDISSACTLSTEIFFVKIAL